MSRARGARKRPTVAVLRFSFAAIVLAAAFAGCANVAREAPRVPSARALAKERVHVVRPGDTLYKIAWQHGIDQRDLARWNGIRNPDVLRAGQRLRLTPPAGARASSAPASAAPASRSSRRVGPAPAPRPAPAPVPPVPQQPPPVWAWPVDGPILSRFGTGAGVVTGVGIGARVGEPVHAAAAGRVVYAGSGLIGYGQLVIIKHNDTYLTAYGYNSELLVSQGQDVTRGQTIASVGLGPERQPRLHFEIRRNGVPIDPLQFLPGR